MIYKKPNRSKIVFCSNFFIILIISILFQGCYSYREVNINSVAANGKTYKIKEGYDQRKIKIITVKDSSLVVEDWEGQREIKKSEIAKIKAKEFNGLLTAGVVVASLVLVIPSVLFAVLFSFESL